MVGFLVNQHSALKAVVEKVSLTLANKQGSVGPKPRGNPLKMAKGKKVNIPSLFYRVRKAVTPCWSMRLNIKITEELSFLYNRRAGLL